MLSKVQTKIREGGTKDEMWIFDILFKYSSPKLSTHAPEKCFENPHFIFCSSFPNLRLGGYSFIVTLAFPNEDYLSAFGKVYN
jgi:hypothetical protein